VSGVTRLRIGTYNLRDGGYDDDGRDDSRLRRQLQMMRRLDIDVWAVQEAKFWDGRTGAWSALFRAEEMLGMRGFPVESNHDGCHLILFVRPPIRVLSVHHDRRQPYWHALCHLRVRVSGAELSLVNLHLAPASPSIRLAEAETLALIKKERPVIAVGDLNAMPAADPEPPLEGIDPQQARRKLDRRPALALEEAHFVDIGAHTGDLTPTVGHRGRGLRYRCDRIYTTLPQATITGYQVMVEQQPDSDHRPVTATFAIGKT
jgi:endonuclease/exonuclease/phosphatase family metal-dependent hydrolase